MPLLTTGALRGAVTDPPGTAAASSAGWPAVPLRYAMYAGTIGNTHGERKDSIPARRATG
jgi:hypothetical protein